MDTFEIQQYIKKLRPGFWGKCCYYLFSFRKKVVLANMKQVFQNSLTPGEVKKLAQSFYAHLLRTIAENILMRFYSEEKLRSKGIVLGHEILLKIADQNKGVAILTGHFGNWELAPIVGILNFKEFQGRFHFVRKKQAEIIEKILFRRYYQAGLKVVPQHNSLDKVCEILANKDAVVFIMDQHGCVNARHGIPVDFFGRKAGTYKSLAMIAQYMEVPVVPALSYRREDGKHVLEFFEPLPALSGRDANEELLLNTRAYNAALEKMLLSHPEQWFWAYRRWKLKPEI